jgi:hypothetical protein
MVQRKLHQKDEFYITVTYYKRSYCYRVKHQPLNNGEEIFNIITKQKTVVLTSKRPQLCDQALIDNKQVYTYDEQEITNKCLMNRIIEAIDRHTNSTNKRHYREQLMNQDSAGKLSKTNRVKLLT